MSRVFCLLITTLPPDSLNCHRSQHTRNIVDMVKRERVVRRQLQSHSSLHALRRHPRGTTNTDHVFPGSILSWHVNMHAMGFLLNCTHIGLDTHTVLRLTCVLAIQRSQSFTSIAHATHEDHVGRRCLWMWWMWSKDGVHGMVRGSTILPSWSSGGTS